eukprot:scaffold1287_cov121-Isochrysis_galbana.AAC.1
MPFSGTQWVVLTISRCAIVGRLTPPPSPPHAILRHPEEELANLPGVSETVVGYCGGTSPDPTYKSIGDHTEALRVTFDTRQVIRGGGRVYLWASIQWVESGLVATLNY